MKYQVNRWELELYGTETTAVKVIPIIKHVQLNGLRREKLKIVKRLTNRHYYLDNVMQIRYILGDE